jgi:hypothetical protein
MKMQGLFLFCITDIMNIMNFENKPINFQPKPLSENKELMSRILEQKTKIVDSFRPKEKDFSDLYSEEEINSDLLEVKRLKDIWNKEEKSEREIYIRQISDIYEGVITDQIEANSWFGENCETYLTTEYDDKKNGVDAVSIFAQKESKSYLGLGIDVTFASNKDALEKKLESIKQCIRIGTLPSLKYFEDPDTKEHKKIFLPKVIVGSRLSSAEKLIELWGDKNDSNRNKKLQENPVQSKIIMESIYQLKYFYDYALNLSQNTKETDMVEKYKNIAKEYGKMYNIFYDIYVEKKEMISSHSNEIYDDIVYETISKYTGNRK